MLFLVFLLLPCFILLSFRFSPFFPSSDSLPWCSVLNTLLRCFLILFLLLLSFFYYFFFLLSFPNLIVFCAAYFLPIPLFFPKIFWILLFLLIISFLFYFHFFISSFPFLPFLILIYAAFFLYPPVSNLFPSFIISSLSFIFLLLSSSTGLLYPFYCFFFHFYTFVDKLYHSFYFRSTIFTASSPFPF